ncbi:MAG: histidine kinase dimerization/phosphoacceptor domain -containing protein [Bacteroidota bacterium]
MPYKLHSFFFLFAALLLYCKINFGQTPSPDRNSDYIITKRILTAENGLPGNSVICAIQDKDGFMWFGTDKGLCRYDGKSFTSYSKEKDGLAGNTINQLFLDDSNRLVIVSAGNMVAQLNLMDLRTYTISTAKSIGNYAFLKPPLNWKTNETSNLKFLDNSIALNLENKRIEIYSKKELSNLPTLVFWGNYLDQYDNNWLCTSSGLFQIRYRQNLFNNYLNDQPTGPFNDKQVRNIYTEANFKNKNDKSDKRIFTCLGNKLIIQKNNTVKTVASKDFYVYSLLKTPGKFYVGGSQLLVLDLEKPAFKVEANIDSREIWAMHPAAPRTIYFGTNTGVYLYNDSTRKSVLLKASNSSFPLPSFIYRFVQTVKHGLFAVAQNGLFQIKDNSIADYYGPGARYADHKLPIAEIYDMHEDKEGICWIASNGNGLFRWNWAPLNKNGALQNFSLQAGVPSNILCRIEEDDNNNLWISTFNGLFSFNTKTQMIYSFRTADGIINNEFNRASSFKGPDGRMYFGTINGLTAFYPAEVLKNDIIDAVPFQVTMINKYSAAKNDFEPCINEYRQRNKIVIHPGEGILTVEFSLLDFEQRPHVYQYIIEGSPGKWKQGEGNTLNINSLPYGEFNVRIKARLANGQWNPVEIDIPIVVLKPFYRKPWFIILCIIALAALTSWYFTSKTNKLLRSKITLESLVQSRTNSLSKALHEKDLLIKEVHHRVKNNLQVIISLLHLQNDKITDEHMKLSILESQSRIGSIALIHQNLYQNDQLDGIRFDEFVMNLGKQLDDFYKKLHREIILETDIVNACIDIDTAVPLGLILNELFSNTYKHAFKNTSRIKVTVLLQEMSKGEYRLVYHDSGPGLSEELRFNNAETLGLELIRGLAKQLHGKASYQYREGGEFTISFKDSITRKND